MNKDNGVSWLIDSSAFLHMISRRDIMNNLIYIPPVFVSFPDGNHIVGTFWYGMDQILQSFKSSNIQIPKTFVSKDLISSILKQP